MVKKDYIYWESYPEEEFNYIECLDSYANELVRESEYEFYPQLKAYPSGYYKVEYITTQDYELDCCGNVQFYYTIIDEIKVIKRSMFIGRLKFFLKKHDLIGYIIKLFGPYWQVRFDFGWFTRTLGGLYLSKALYVRFVNPNHYAKVYSGSKEYKKIEIR